MMKKSKDYHKRNNAVIKAGSDNQAQKFAGNTMSVQCDIISGIKKRIFHLTNVSNSLDGAIRNKFASSHSNKISQ